MTQSPGHQKYPDHKVEEKNLKQHVQVELDGEIVADSKDVIEVDEDGHQLRYYIPLSDVKDGLLSHSNTHTKCPFKGEAHYYDLNFGSKSLHDGAWSYDDPYDEHRALQGHVAFYDEVPDINIHVRH